MKYIVQGKRIYKHHKRYPYSIFWWDLESFNDPVGAYAHITKLKLAGLTGEVRVVERVEIIIKEAQKL